MINFHPSLNQLNAFVAGDLAPTEALMVSAHCDMCQHCQNLVADISDEMAMMALHQDSQSDDPTLDLMLADIIQQPQAETRFDSDIIIAANEVTIELDGRSFILPRSLARFADKMGNWSSMVGKLWQAPVDLGAEGVAHFIYMGKGGNVPEHTHRGSEMTLVINGEFSDGINHYDSGDFMRMTPEHTHAPRSESEDGCLVFTIVDKPLHFTSGLARLLNPFSHLFFR
jgi:putative transcriptional regulator